ncbi:class I SAM-dependent methyltransferase [Halomicrobium salinisoli]|uniref:class I SAM-dependent methyltransferase n=1 Tax=Halomicrobium salinisoli TaxID=2878391 RepID=UPI001CF0B8AB|nr:class I SAM-dependent methyltransferase [Halomicrobium salinisoli]
MGERRSIDPEHRAHLERSERVWNRRSDGYGRSERDFAPMLDAAVERLGVGPGDAVLEVGCGPGTNFERLHDLVGPEGRLVAVDYSPAMVERARERARENGFDNVDVIRGDATRTAFEPASFDAALASLSLSVTPDAEAALRRVREALVPGGRLVVFDLQRIQSGPLRIVNPLVVAFLQWYGNWNPDEDVRAALRATFETVEVEATYTAGTTYRAVAEKAADA